MLAGWAHARRGSLGCRLLGARLAAILDRGFIVRGGSGIFLCNRCQRRKRSILQSSEEAGSSTAIAASTIWEVAKGRELDPEVPPRPQQPWRTRCPRLCESGAALREAGWWSPRREAAALRLSAAYCSPWTPRCGGSSLPCARRHA